jgi:ABC-type uncharacterized transport system permease subunit
MSIATQIEPDEHGLYARPRAKALTHSLGQIGLQAVSLIIGMGLVVALLAWSGYDIGDVLGSMVKGAFGTPYNLGMSLTQAVPLMLCAVAVWIAFQAGLFNIGADGQLQVGGLVALLIVTRLPDSFPTIAYLIAGCIAGCLGGALWGGIAGLLKAYRGANEVISTIMLNIIASTSIMLLIAGPLKAQTSKFTAQSERIADAAVMGDAAPGLPWIFVIAVVVSVASIILVRRTALGLRLRAVGLNPDAATHAGLTVRVIQWNTFALSGATAGLSGALVLLGFRYYIAPGWAASWGLLAIVIAFLALRAPLMIVAWAVIFGMINASGVAMKGAASVPDSVTTLMQALPVICIFILLVIPKTGLYRSVKGTLTGRGVT